MNQGKVTFKVKQEEAGGQAPSRGSRGGTNQSQRRRGGKAAGQANEEGGDDPNR